MTRDVLFPCTVAIARTYPRHSKQFFRLTWRTTTTPRRNRVLQTDVYSYGLLYSTCPEVANKGVGVMRITSFPFGPRPFSPRTKSHRCFVGRFTSAKGPPWRSSHCSPRPHFVPQPCNSSFLKRSTPLSPSWSFFTLGGAHRRQVVGGCADYGYTSLANVSGYGSV